MHEQGNPQIDVATIRVSCAFLGDRREEPSLSTGGLGRNGRAAVNQDFRSLDTSQTIRRCTKKLTRTQLLFTYHLLVNGLATSHLCETKTVTLAQRSKFIKTIDSASTKGQRQTFPLTSGDGNSAG